MSGFDSHPEVPESVPPLPLPEFEYEDLQTDERIGTGGDADVYRTHLDHEGYTYPVAIKEPRFEGTIHRDALDPFKSEAETWSKLSDHDNIVSVYEWGITPRPWLALEYMDGGTLQSKIGDADLEEALWLAGRIAEGIHYGHRHGVAHLDLKPTNILLRDTETGTWDYPKVSDWGLAKLLLEHSNSIDGISPTYAAPEQFDADTFGTPDDITDIYQFGAVVYALLTGEPPFSGPSTAVMQGVLKEEPTPPSEVNTTVPSAVDEAILKAIAKRKADRYSSIALFQQELDKLFSEYATDGEYAVDEVTGSANAQGSPAVTGETDSKTDGPTNAGSSDTADNTDTVETSVTTGTEQETTPTSQQSQGESTSDQESSLLTRRRAVGLLGVGVLGAGGAWLSGSNGGEDSSAGTTIPAGTPTTTATPRRSSTATETEAETQTETDQSVADSEGGGSTGSELSGTWSTYQYDKVNSGFVEGAASFDGPLSPRWEFASEDQVTAAPVIADGTLYVGDHSGTVYALDYQSGEVIWESAAGQAIYSSADIAGDQLIFGNEDGHLYSLRRSDGQVRWRARIGGSVLAQTATENSVYAVRSGYGQLASVGLNQGRVNWRYEAAGNYTGSNMSTAPAVTSEVIIIGSANSYITAVDPESGAKRWTYDTGDSGVRSLGDNPGTRVKGDPTVADGTVYTGNNEGFVYAVGLSGGESRWQYQTGGLIIGSPSVMDDTIYVGSNDGILYALNAEDGTEQWQFNARVAIRTAPICTDSNVIFGDSEGTIYSIDPSNGQQRWEFSPGDSGISSPVLVDDTLFVTEESGYVYALAPA